MYKFLRFLIKTLAIVFIIMLVVFFSYVGYITRDLPNYKVLSNYQPAVLTRIHSEDGKILAEFATKKRLYLPIEDIPERVRVAFLSAEDKNFYQHIGVDFIGMGRAIFDNIRNLGHNKRPIGASTITQQVAKNLLLSSDISLKRKIREAILALRIEKTYSKDHILELYLNEIYLGLGCYGIASASLTYFDKPVDQLSLSETAYLASLPKGPANYNPFTHADRAIQRRNWVIDRMLENQYITNDEANSAKQQPLNVSKPSNRNFFHGGEYFTEEVRRQILAKYGSKMLYEGGLSVRTTLMTKYQLLAQNVLRNGLIQYDRKRGWHGVYQHIDLNSGEWGRTLAQINTLEDLPDWKLAVVLNTNNEKIIVGLRPNWQMNKTVSKNREKGEILISNSAWAFTKQQNGKTIKITKASELVQPGDVIFVHHISGSSYSLEQIPKLEGAMIVMEPKTGRVLAMVGGFSYALSEFNRATQAHRQPGSAFKPFVYAAALDNGYLPSDIIYDGPITVEQGESLGIWKPKNFEGNSSGARTLRYGLEHSRNLITIRLAYALGIKTVAEYAERFGIYNKMPHLLSMVLGAGDTTVMRLMTAYATIANGGHDVRPSLVDRIQNRYGKTIYRNDSRECIGCNRTWDENPEEAQLKDNRIQVLDPLTDYQVVNLLQGVVNHGTGRLLLDLKRPIAAKTGTTNDSKEAWFFAFTPDLLAGIYLGYDIPTELGHWETGGGLSGPIVKNFLEEALKNKPKSDFLIPKEITFMPVNQNTGMLAEDGDGDGDVLIDPFKPGETPSKDYHVLGADFFKKGVAITPASPDATNAIETGKTGLF